MSEAPSAALPPGRRIAEYEIVRVLGAGGFGITYLAYDYQLDGPVAIKEYFPADLAVRVDGERVAATAPTNQETFAWGFDRFMAEARAIHRFRHPNVVRAHRYLEANGTAYIVMEYVEGESLKAILDRRGTLPAQEWRPWLDALLDGLAHVHGHDYLHRDIKPANIVIRAEDGEPVLIDFGAARVQHGDRTHTQVLTAGYAPIEQYSTGAEQGPPTDIYALAAVSYRVLTGDVVPSAPDRVLKDDYEPLTERVTDGDAGWLAALDRGLAVKSEARPRDVDGWSTALGTGSAHEATSSAPGYHWDPAEDEATPKKLGVVKRLRRILGRPLASFRFTLGVFFFVWTENYAVAEAWFRKAADLDHPYGQAWLGLLYVDGAFPFSLVDAAKVSEVPKDEARAARWFRKAAAQGLADAKLSLAMMYAAGVGVRQDYSKAERWCRRAAERGDPHAQNVLGIVHAAGTGSLKDFARAEGWFLRAASPGRMPGRRFLLLPGRRHSGWPIARFNLGCLYATAQERRDVDAAKWFREAAEQGVWEAQNALGVMHAAGRGLPQDSTEAERRFNEAEIGSLAARYNLGVICARRGDDAKARQWFQESAESGDPMAQSALGFLYAEGRTYAGEEWRDHLARERQELGSELSSYSLVYNARDSDLSEAESSYREAVESLSDLAREDHSMATCPSATWRLRGPGLHPFPQRRVSGGFWAGSTNTHASASWLIPVQDGWSLAYAYGWGSEPEESGPLTWFLKGAERGHAAAQHSLGRLYKHGWGVPADRSESLMWFRLAAKQGYAEAQADLGRLYESGDGVSQDYGEALKWYRRAAKRGHARATRLLASCYDTGTGVPVDKVAAARLYSVAVELGEHSAAADLRRLTSEGWSRPGVDQSGDLPFDAVEWREWCRRSAEAGHAEAQALLGKSYRLDNRLSQEPFGSALRRAIKAKALTWYTRAADQGCALGQVGLADMYEHGEAALDEQDTETARLETSAGSGTTGEIDHERKPSREDLAEAAKWYRKAAEQEDADGQEKLGSAYRRGRGVAVDGPEAIKWYRRAARQGHTEAQILMGYAYEEGVDRSAWSGPRTSGVLRDSAVAYAWFSLSDRFGDIGLRKGALARLQTEEERDRAHLLAAKYREDYVQPFAWR